MSSETAKTMGQPHLAKQDLSTLVSFAVHTGVMMCMTVIDVQHRMPSLRALHHLVD